MLDRILHGSAFWGWRVGASLAQRLPSWITYPAAVVGGEIAYVFWTGRRRIAKQNFAVVLALPADDREVARVEDPHPLRRQLADGRLRELRTLLR